MSLTKTNRTTSGTAALGARAKDRAKDAAAQAIPLGKRAGTTAAQGVRGAREWTAPRFDDVVQTTREWAAPRLDDAVQGAREWAAPRLEGAADAVTTTVAPKISSALTTTVAPKVSSALRSTASQVRPDGATTSRSGLRRLLNWRWLLGIGALLAAAGATTAITMRRRYAAATAEAKDATAEPDAEGEPGAADPVSDDARRAEVNGQVTTPRP